MKFTTEGIMKLDGYYDEESWAEVQPRHRGERIRIDQWNQAGLRNMTPKSMELFGSKKVRVTIETIDEINTIPEYKMSLMISWDEYGKSGAKDHYYEYQVLCENCKHLQWVAILKGTKASGSIICKHCCCITKVS